MNEVASNDINSMFDVDLNGDLPEDVDVAALKRMRAVARILDDGMRLPGTDFRFGIDPIVGILPGGGDAITSLVSLYIVYEASRLGVSRETLVQMLVNIAIDTVGGSVPVLGTLFDAVWRSNRRNFELALRDLASDSDSGAVEPVTVDVE